MKVILNVQSLIKSLLKATRSFLSIEVAGYRIDLVVEGEKGRIAVECDGDQWHGPERYDYDMNRQRILERCGWKFWRVRGSDYYYDPEGPLLSMGYIKLL